MKKILISLVLMTIVPLSVSAELRWVGDIDKDGKLSLKDLTEMIQVLRDRDKTPVKSIKFYDMNGDDKFDEKDIAELRDILLGKKEGRQLWDEETIPIGDKDDTPFD